MKIPYNKMYYFNEEIENIEDCLKNSVTSSDGEYTSLCENWFKDNINRKTILTVSCTAALEMAAILANIKTGDEVIMPSFTFVSTANAFVLRGAVPVFVDINPQTMNIDENLIEPAITQKTKAVVVVHYAGVACNMSKIMKIAKKHNLIVIEDAAHAFDAQYNNENLGCIGDIGCYSFHETKNITSGEGGAIILNNERYKDAADIISEKGTNRKLFKQGGVDKYTWINIGSSYRMADINAALLYAQLKIHKQIKEKRIHIWNTYFNFFKKFEEKGILKCPFIPDYAGHNAHIFYLLFNNEQARTKFMNFMNENGISTVSHYVPLHSSPGGKQYAKIGSSMNNTEKAAATLLRLPLFYNLTDEHINYICKKAEEFFNINMKDEK